MARARPVAGGPPARLPALEPLDVRLTNALTAVVCALGALAVVAAGTFWLMRTPWFAIRAVQLEGDLVRNNLLTIRANAMPRLAGNFFSLDLAQAKAAFEAVPWVRRAIVRRVWPDRLVVRLEEHRAAALWRGPDGEDDRLVNSFGEIFEANVGDVEDEALPVLQGPEADSAQMLALLQRVAPLLARRQLEAETLLLSGRGSWRVELAGGAVVELGRGSIDEIAARTDRFVRTLDQVTARYQAAIEYADLRHADGYALRMQGIRTAGVAAANRPSNPSHETH